MARLADEQHELKSSRPVRWGCCRNRADRGSETRRRLTNKQDTERGQVGGCVLRSGRAGGSRWRSRRTPPPARPRRLPTLHCDEPPEESSQGKYESDSFEARTPVSGAALHLGHQLPSIFWDGLALHYTPRDRRPEPEDHSRHVHGTAQADNTAEDNVDITHDWCRVYRPVDHIAIGVRASSAIRSQREAGDRRATARIV
jgi:hypothetical protein